MESLLWHSANSKTKGTSASALVHLKHCCVIYALFNEMIEKANKFTHAMGFLRNKGKQVSGIW
jgi:hypothetical protein